MFPDFDKLLELWFAKMVWPLRALTALLFCSAFAAVCFGLASLKVLLGG